MLNRNMLKWIATTIDLVVDEAASTEATHTITIVRDGDALRLTWAKGYTEGNNTLSVNSWDAREQSRGVLCAMLAMEAVKLAEQQPYPAIPVPLTSDEMRLVREGKKIEAIKAMRERFAAVGVTLSLKDAKDSICVEVDRLESLQ